MVKLIVVGEGQTEEHFVTEALAPVLARSGVYVTPRLINTSPVSRGGARNLERVRRFIGRTLKERSDIFVTTFFDLYGLDTTFRGITETKGFPPADRASEIERALHEDIVTYANCRPERFFAHVQPHEFEALLFSDVGRLCEIEPGWAASAAGFQKIRSGVKNPEWINDSRATAPSRRLAELSPRYRKTTHGPLGVTRIGLDRIRHECPHFCQWFDRLLALKPL